MKPRRSKSSYTLLAGLTGLLVIGAWFAYGIYSALTKSQVTERQATAIIPLTESIRVEVVDNLDRRRKFSPADFSQLVLNITESTTSTSAGSIATSSANQP
jgi:hypothetical protein